MRSRVRWAADKFRRAVIGGDNQQGNKFDMEDAEKVLRRKQSRQMNLGQPQSQACGVGAHGVLDTERSERGQVVAKSTSRRCRRCAGSPSALSAAAKITQMMGPVDLICMHRMLAMLQRTSARLRSREMCRKGPKIPLIVACAKARPAFLTGPALNLSGTSQITPLSTIHQRQPRRFVVTASLGY